MEKNNGFTLIEILVVLAIIAIMSSTILFGTVQYINKSKDSNSAGNLAVLVPAGEAFYNIGATYEGFCDSNVVLNVKSQLSENPNSPCYDRSGNLSGLCCYVRESDGNAWAACLKEFSGINTAFCVDSRGVKKQICNSSCNALLSQCPSDELSSCE